ncbi:MAG: methyltransferase domain-containing protein [Bacteroidota bacterium]|nr:methyltransferase domain-containing protein [Bacteroidota bacterium]
MMDEKNIKQDWDIYWADKDKKDRSNKLYDIIAEVYRTLIIKNILNHFIKKYFSKGWNVLHAGCGSGQVDVGLSDYINITALDISPNALKIYQGIHGEKCKTIQGNIFKLPFPNDSFDGLYNLGVMEHFTHEDINLILSEFKRVLKPTGKIIIFWPPKFGLTVFVLDSAHFILNKIFKMNVKLHPEEISRIQSKKQANEIFHKAGFIVEEYYFGVRDIFTQAVIVARKIN